jgi:hypothetical protein
MPSRKPTQPACLFYQKGKPTMTTYSNPQLRVPSQEELQARLATLMPDMMRSEFSQTFLEAIDLARFEGDAVMVQSLCAALGVAIDIWQRQDGIES